jgi:hypothetical protein
MRVLTEGDDGLRNFVQRSSPKPMESQLDWFHIGMRLEVLRKSVTLPTTYHEYLADPHAFSTLLIDGYRIANLRFRGPSGFRYPLARFSPT